MSMSEWTWYIWVMIGVLGISFVLFWIVLLVGCGVFDKRDSDKTYISPFDLWMEKNHYGNWQPLPDPPEVEVYD